MAQVLSPGFSSFEEKDIWMAESGTMRVLTCVVWYFRLSRINMSGIDGEFRET